MGIKLKLGIMATIILCVLFIFLLFPSEIQTCRKQVNIESSFSIDGYSIRIPKEEVCLKCSNISLTIHNNSYPCFVMDSFPDPLWEAPTCIIVNDGVWLNLNLTTNETLIGYFYYEREGYKRCLFSGEKNKND